MAILKIELLSKIYKRGFWGRPFQALDRLSLEVDEGEIFGFLGPNGAGKTTTMKLLLGLIYPTSGNAWLLGQSIGQRSVSKRIGYMPENPYFYRFLTGLESLTFYGRLGLLDKETRLDRANALLERVGLSRAKDVRIGEYSKGMMQRIGLAQSLMSDPQLLLLDEPLSGLDPSGRKEISDVILDLRKQGKTIFFSSHILSDVEILCDRIGILNRGQLRSVGKVSELVGTKVHSIAIETSKLPERQLEALKSVLLRRQDLGADHTLLEVESQDHVDLIVKTCMESGAKVISVIPRKESLEDYFLREVKEVSK